MARLGAAARGRRVLRSPVIAAAVVSAAGLVIDRPLGSVLPSAPDPSLLLGAAAGLFGAFLLVASVAMTLFQTSTAWPATIARAVTRDNDHVRLLQVILFGVLVAVVGMIESALGWTPLVAAAGAAAGLAVSVIWLTAYLVAQIHKLEPLTFAADLRHRAEQHAKAMARPGPLTSDGRQSRAITTATDEFFADADALFTLGSWLAREARRPSDADEVLAELVGVARSVREARRARPALRTFAWDQPGGDPFGVNYLPQVADTQWSGFTRTACETDLFWVEKYLGFWLGRYVAIVSADGYRAESISDWADWCIDEIRDALPLGIEPAKSFLGGFIRPLGRETAANRHCRDAVFGGYERLLSGEGPDLGLASLVVGHFRDRMTRPWGQGEPSVDSLTADAFGRGAVEARAALVFARHGGTAATAEALGLASAAMAECADGLAKRPKDGGFAELGDPYADMYFGARLGPTLALFAAVRPAAEAAALGKQWRAAEIGLIGGMFRDLPPFFWTSRTAAAVDGYVAGLRPDAADKRLADLALPAELAARLAAN